ncbi:YciI family protein [Corynebacterium sp. YIM 101645]|uniref:YciI family protein n=1 Tax=Corynebacterium lemuris TaxID=1859292 RepID=A0ABT2FSJ3_9CORY|nr:YciI family protein [Corynebacterium lemuris]MCS5478186.1 YciI family protein [Corynebacterium lemuris]
MSQFMLSVHHVPGSEPYASEEEMQAAFAAVAAFNQQLADDGRLVFVGALHSETDIVTAKGVDEPPVREGAQLGGFWVVEVDGRADARKLAEQASAACRQPIEVREFESS